MSEVGKIEFEQSKTMIYSAVGLRDQMAMAALKEISFSLDRSGGWLATETEALAKYCYAVADAMMAARDE